MAEQDGFLRHGIARAVKCEPPGYAGREGPVYSSVALAVTGAQHSSWRLRLYAELDGQMVLVGSVRTLRGSGGQRLVATAFAPGAKAWEVRGDRLPSPRWATDNGAEDRQIAVRLTASDVGGAPGVSAVPGHAELSTVRGYATGVAGAVVVPGAVVGWTVHSVVGGTVAVDDGAAIQVEAGGTVSGASLPECPWGHSFVFVGTSAYLVEYEVSAPGAGA